MASWCWTPISFTICSLSLNQMNKKVWMDVPLCTFQTRLTTCVTSSTCCATRVEGENMFLHCDMQIKYDYIAGIISQIKSHNTLPFLQLLCHWARSTRYTTYGMKPLGLNPWTNLFYFVITLLHTKLAFLVNDAYSLTNFKVEYMIGLRGIVQFRNIIFPAKKPYQYLKNRETI